MIFETHLSRQFAGPNSTLGVWKIAGCERSIYVLEPKLYDAIREKPFAADPGRYQVVWTDSPKFGHYTLELIIPHRDGMRVHTGTTYHHTLGCLLPGYDYRKVEDDYEIVDVDSSVRARDRVNRLLLAYLMPGNKAFVTITNPEVTA